MIPKKDLPLPQCLRHQSTLLLRLKKSKCTLKRQGFSFEKIPLNKTSFMKRFSPKKNKTRTWLEKNGGDMLGLKHLFYHCITKHSSIKNKKTWTLRLNPMYPIRRLQIKLQLSREWRKTNTKYRSPWTETRN